MDVFGVVGATAPALSGQSRAALAKQGLSLTQGQLANIDAARREALAACERVEYAAGAVDALVLAFAGSPYLGQGDVGEVLAEAMGVFYDVREDVPIDAPDDEVLAALRRAFDTVGGDVEAIDAPAIAGELMARELRAACEMGNRDDDVADASGVYRIADDTGRVYCWLLDWEYDEFAPGWDGERRADDLE